MTQEERWLECYFFPNRQVILVLRVGQNHYVERAKADLDDEAQLEELCQRLMTSPVTDSKVYYHELKPSPASFCFAIKREQLENGNFVWRTPTQGVIEGENQGSLMASTLNSYYSRQVNLAQLRNLDQTYLSVLNAYGAYLSSISDPLFYPSKVEPIQDLLEKERYLWLAEDDKLVSAYAHCWRLINHFYGRYQIMVR